MKNLTTTERDLIIIIMDCMFANTGISSHKEYPGITLSDIEDGHICHLTISTESKQFFNRLNDILKYKSSMNYHKEIETLGYSDCISGAPEPVNESIFSTEYCDNLCWYSEGFVVSVCVSNIYIDFKSIEKVILKLKQCNTYGFTLDTEKLIKKIYDNISSGIYDLNEDEYI